MSESIRRKNSSRQLLQNLIRVTAQRSQEDAEEVERERRRRSREKERGEGSPSWPEPPQHSDLALNTELDEDLKPSCCLVLEEDEGFSDWSHRLENRNEPEVPEDCRARVQRPSTPPQWRPKPEEEKQQQGEDEARCEPARSCWSQKASTRRPEKISSNRKEVRTSYSSSVFLPQHATGQPPDRTSYLVAGTMKPRGGACRVDGEVNRRSEEVNNRSEEVNRRSEEANRRSEEVNRRSEEVNNRSEEANRRSEEANRRSEEVNRRSEEVNNRSEEANRRSEEANRRSEEVNRRSEEVNSRSEEVNRRSTASRCSSSDGDESLHCYGPMSPTFKKLLIQFYPDEANSRVSTDGKCTIIERTESLRKSTNNIKKTPPPVPVSKIDKKLEQYTHALEVSSKEGRSGGQVLTDLTSPTEPVASKKNLFETWNQSAVAYTPTKDADGLKVGVANLINQWVRGSEDGSRCSSPFKPADSSSGKRYKFVVTGHGKYEKVSVDDGCSDDANSQSGGQFYEDL
ncbi:uncharacterized protein ABDE67_005992 [Symphorus nematophorus]